MVAPGDFTIMLLEGTRKDTVIGDVRSLAGSDVNSLLLKTEDKTSKALFEVRTDGKVVCGQDIILKEVANNDVVAMEYTFNITSEKDGTEKPIAQFFVLIFKNMFSATVNENWIGTVMSYRLLSDRFSVKLSSLPQSLSMSDHNTIQLKNGADFETTPDGKIKFELELRTTNPDRRTTIEAEIKIQDENDNAPELEKNKYSFTILAGSRKGTVVGVVSATDDDTVGTLSYVLSGSFSNDFDVDSTGTITAKRSLEKRVFGDKVVLTVTAYDGKSHSRTAEIFVNLESVVPPEKHLNLTFTGTVPENTGSGYFVVNVFQTNYTGYTFINKLADDMFTLDAKTGIISTAREFDREDKTFPNPTDFSIQAEIEHGDQCFPVNIGNLQVTITDINDNDPEFSKTSYRGSVDENSPQDVLVTGLIDKVVTDADAGPNGEVSFSLSGDDSEYFKVQGTGNRFTIKTSKPIDGDNIPMVNLTITAKDRPTDPQSVRSANALVIIEINDRNDRSPVFESGSRAKSVLEGQTERIATLTATDLDVSENNKKISYYIIDGDHGMFNITENGELWTKKPLDRESHDNFVLTVMARDHGSPPLTATTSFTVSVIDVNDNSPKFEQTQYEVNVNERPETSCSTAPLLTINATDADIGNNGIVRFSLTNSDLDIDPQTGVIRCKKALNYDKEATNDYSMTVLAIDQGSPPLTSSVNVMIHVLDVNDNFPQFTKSDYTATVYSGQATNGKPILVIEATDADSGDNGKVEFTLDKNTDIFAISGSNIGVLRVVDGVHLKPQVYEFKVIATDKGSPSRSNETLVRLSVTSSSHSSFGFDRTDFNFTMEEERNYGTTVIGRVQVKDSTPVDYSLDEPKGFSIDTNTGELKCNAVQDREENTYQKLIVRATGKNDVNKSDIAVINVEVTDINDHKPKFTYTAAHHVFRVREDVSLNHVVTTMLATDADAGENGRIVFSLISQSPKPHFTIHQEDGTISVSNKLNREEVNKYTLIVQASDQGSSRETATMEVKIDIEDVNDNLPVFSLNYTVTVMENEPDYLSLNVFSVTATDADFGENGRVLYKTDTTDKCPLVVTNEETGRMGLSRELDYESAISYQCIVRAVDQGTPPLTGTTTVTVSVSDVNDNSPEFIGAPYTANVSRNAAVNDVVSKDVRASDKDSTADGNGVVKFYMLTEQNYFNIDRDTGEITVATSLHDVQENAINLKIEARDIPQRGEHRNARTDMRIDIDSDESFPFFNKTFSFTVTEEKEPTEKVLVYAQAYVRRDSQVFVCNMRNNCTYTLNSVGETNAHVKDAMTIDPTTGGIRQVQKINREESGNSFKLDVTVMDSTTGLSRVTGVLVKVEDINDNRPYFQNIAKTFIVKQAAPIGTVITHLTSMDDDLDSQPLYSVVPGYDHPKIGLWENGTLYTSQSLRNETTIEISIQVTENDLKASDDILKDVILTQRVLIEVRGDDYNENAPIFTMCKAAEVPALSKKGTPVTTVKATDKDNNTVKYSIQSGNVRDIIKINNSNGTLTLQYDFDLDATISNITLVVIVVDDVRSPKTGTCTVRITIVDPTPTECIAANEFEALKLSRQERTTFMSLFIAMAVLLTVVGILALVALYKWRTSVKLHGSRYAENITSHDSAMSLPKGKKTEYDSPSGPSAQEEPYSQLQNRNFSTGTVNPAYVSADRREPCVPPPEPPKDYEDNELQEPSSDSVKYQGRQLPSGLHPSAQQTFAAL